MSNQKENIVPRNVDGHLHGLWICYHSNGKLWFKRRWVNGILHGIYEWYHGNGKLYYKQYWINGRCVYCELYGTENRIEFRI